MSWLVLYRVDCRSDRGTERDHKVVARGLLGGSDGFNRFFYGVARRSVPLEERYQCVVLFENGIGFFFEGADVTLDGGRVNVLRIEKVNQLSEACLCRGDSR